MYIITIKYKNGEQAMTPLLVRSLESLSVLIDAMSKKGMTTVVEKMDCCADCEQASEYLESKI